MTNQTVSWITVGCLMCLSAIVALAAQTLHGLDAKVGQAITKPKDEAMQTITQQVTRANETVVTVSTVRLDSEKLADWIARHDAAVEALQG